MHRSDRPIILAIWLTIAACALGAMGLGGLLVFAAVKLWSL